MSDKLQWKHGVTDHGESQWTAEALGVTYVITEMLAISSWMLTATAFSGSLERPTQLDSLEDATRLAQEWADKWSATP
jgi:hypothetical protein